MVYTVGSDGPRRLGSAAARESHVLYYHHPVPLLQAVLAEDAGMAATVSNLRQEMGHDVVDVTTADGIQLTLHLDRETTLPLSISSMAYNANLGDVVTTTSFSNYADAGGFVLPHELSRTVDGLPSTDLLVTQTVNGEIRDLAAPAGVASAAEPEPEPATVTVEELASGVWFLAGQSHHSVLVEFSEYTVLVEAPQHDTRTLAVIEQARELVPDKPLRYVVNTHHHFDHSGGLRAAVAEGLTVITHESNRSLFDDLTARHPLAGEHEDRLAVRIERDRAVRVDGDQQVAVAAYSIVGVGNQAAAGRVSAEGTASDPGRHVHPRGWGTVCGYCGRAAPERPGPGPASAKHRADPRRGRAVQRAAGGRRGSGRCRLTTPAARRPRAPRRT